MGQGGLVKGEIGSKVHVVATQQGNQDCNDDSVQASCHYGTLTEAEVPNLYRQEKDYLS